MKLTGGYYKAQRHFFFPSVVVKMKSCMPFLSLSWGRPLAGCSANFSFLVEAVREGWGDGPVGKMLTMQVRGAEFNPPEPL